MDSPGWRIWRFVTTRHLRSLPIKTTIYPIFSSMMFVHNNAIAINRKGYCNPIQKTCTGFLLQSSDKHGCLCHGLETICSPDVYIAPIQTYSPCWWYAYALVGCNRAIALPCFNHVKRPLLLPECLVNSEYNGFSTRSDCSLCHKSSSRKCMAVIQRSQYVRNCLHSRALLPCWLSDMNLELKFEMGTPFHQSQTSLICPGMYLEKEMQYMYEHNMWFIKQYDQFYLLKRVKYHTMTTMVTMKRLGNSVPDRKTMISPNRQGMTTDSDTHPHLVF